MWPVKNKTIIGLKYKKHLDKELTAPLKIRL